MKIVCISDTHSYHNSMSQQIPDGDVLIHAGDFTGTKNDFSKKGNQHEVIEFNKWLGKLPHQHKILIAGNHDFYMAEHPYTAKDLVTNATYLEDTSTEIDGIKFYGSPYTPWFYDWAFNIKDDSDLIKKWSNIPTDTNVLITHGPPRSFCDLTDRYVNAGCKFLLERIHTLPNLKAHVFGHIHESYGVELYKEVQYVNASICNFQYRPINKPIVIEI